MPKIHLTIPHNLGKDEAKRRVADLIADTRHRFGNMISDVEQTWDGDVESFSFRAMGFAVSGHLTVEPSALLVEVRVPLAALPLKRRMEKEILGRATVLLG